MNATTAYLLYLVFALGAGGIYFLLPRTRGARPLVAAVIGTGALVALMLVIGLRLVNPGATSGCFYLFALIAIGSAARVVTHPKPVYSALYFVLTVIAVASLLVLLQAEFLAVALIIIYAGAILVTYLFVIMLAQQGGAPSYDRSAREPLLAVLTGFVLMAAVAGRAIDLPPSRVLRTGAVTVAAETTQTRFTGGNTNSVGEAIMTRYIVVLELAGVLLLVSMVGAIALA
jgi:NADH-quinone oxidoreductase subunit J